MSSTVKAPPGAFRLALGEWARSDGLMWVFIAKALLTSFVALWLAYRLELPQPSTVLATVFIVMQRQSGEVLAKSFYRIIGTLTGLTVMIPLIALFNQERVLFLLCLALWLGLCTIGSARYRDFRGYACVLAGYTAALIGLPHIHDPENAFIQALWRVLEISLGIICTGLISALVLPQTTSAVLRTQLATRVRDFARYACEALAGPLDPQHLEAIHARLVSESVTLENLRNTSAFEDPEIRMRHGRIGRMNNEFMVFSTRFHSLYQLIRRLESAQEPHVLDALKPCLAIVSGLIEPLRELPFTDDRAVQLAASIEAIKSTLMQQIRDGREQLRSQQASDVELLDYNTACELLFRFTNDLHSYAETHASLIEPHHERERWKGGFAPRANGMAAAVSGIRSAVLVLLMGSFWLSTGWASGNTFVVTGALATGLLALAKNPRRTSFQMLVGAAGGACLGFFVRFSVWPWIEGLELLFASMVPILAYGVFLLGRPQTSGYGVGLLIWFCILTLPTNVIDYAPYQFINNYLAVLFALFIVAVVSALVLPPDRPWLWRRLEHDLRMRVVTAVSAKLKGLVNDFESGTRDLLNQAHGLAVGRPDVQRRLLRWMFAVLEIGQGVIELRQEQATLPDEPCYAEDSEWRLGIRALGRALVRLFIQPDDGNRLRALEAVEQAIAAVRATPEPRAPQFDTSPLRRVLSHLHFIRSSLLDPNSPLAEKTPYVYRRTANAA